MPSKLKKAIGAVKDQTSISLAKVASNASSTLEVLVLKATTHDDVPVDDRYVREILLLVSSNKSNAALCARAIGKRIGRTRNWIVAVKSLILVLRIFQDGDPYFPREVLHAMKRGAKILNLSSFRDDSNSSPWDYTAFVRTFALYLDERLDCFLTGKLLRRYTHHEREPFHRRSRQANEPVRDMKPAMLLDKISYWQRLLDRGVATRPTGAAKMNRLVQISLYAVVQETFDLYKDISDGLALLLDSFFHLQYNSCVNAFQACVKATKQFEELGQFYDLCKGIGVGRTSEYPSVQKISEELIETLREFLKDQASFPATTGRSPKLLPAPPSVAGTSRRHDSYEQSEFSETTERGSEFGSRSCTSLEDLISATELTGASPSISIDLEAYSIADHLQEADGEGSTRSLPVSSSLIDLMSELPHRDRDEADDDGSTRSLPVYSSLLDLVSFDEMPQREPEKTSAEQHRDQVIDFVSFRELQQRGQAREEREGEERDQPPEPISANGWELVLAETATTAATSTQPFTNGFDLFSDHEQPDLSAPAPSSSTGWELVLAETATPPSRPGSGAFDFSSIGNPNQQYYNPFLQDTTELTAIVPVASPATETATGGGEGFPADDGIWGAPTFQAAPTFCAHNGNDMGANDPFGPYPIVGVGEQGGFSGPTNQQQLFKEQELWLQQQNKIIARHMA